MDVQTRCKCDVCRVPSFERNNYYHGKILGVRDLADEQRYFNEKRWLINRMVIGCGIVCGLDVCLEDGNVIVRPGLALDCCGRELLVCAPQTVTAAAIEEALPVSAEPGYTSVPGMQPGYSVPTAPGPVDYSPPQAVPPGNPEPYDQSVPPPGPETYPVPEPVRWVLCLDYRECRAERTRTPAGVESKARGDQYNRIRDSYRLRVVPWKNVCPADYTVDVCSHEALGRGWPLHISLVAKSLKCSGCENCHCVVLATGTLEPWPGHPPYVRLDQDFWRYRPLVYTNRSLAEVVRCFHDGLPRITFINWPPYTHYGAEDFVNRLSQERLQITFDQPMKEHTVTNLRSCRLSIFLTDDGSCPVQMLIPLRHIEYADRTATYYFDEDCIERELRNACKRLRKPADVELTLHGNMIHNRQGRALDAELIDRFPTGNGVEGGEFVAYFSVGP